MSEQRIQKCNFKHYCCVCGFVTQELLERQQSEAKLAGDKQSEKKRSFMHPLSNFGCFTSLHVYISQMYVGVYLFSL